MQEETKVLDITPAELSAEVTAKFAGMVITRAYFRNIEPLPPANAIARDGVFQLYKEGAVKSGKCLCIVLETRDGRAVVIPFSSVAIADKDAFNVSE